MAELISLSPHLYIMEYGGVKKLGTPYPAVGSSPALRALGSIPMDAARLRVQGNSHAVVLQQAILSARDFVNVAAQDYRRTSRKP